MTTKHSLSLTEKLHFSQRFIDQLKTKMNSMSNLEMREAKYLISLLRQDLKRYWVPAE